MLRREWPSCPDAAALLARLNALPGPAVRSTDAMQTRAYSVLGLRRAARAPVVTAAATDAPLPEDVAEAEALVRAEPGRWHARALQQHFGWTVATASALILRLREADAAGAAAP